ncbi:MAG TPA: TetR/AcrR family transcriptional regulator [Spirochaetota bacterium]|nr:TetR/AcrR family transcriptional regulator [Spirochaetota bacterium]HPC42185.1 TetR/AcrR family transcriptional regulator [Spirochaetota bacterium]HQF08245.1 TetR/AcrR family transcriptional regulator [Spirochaetota bacterium]HQH97140.1 TetR/AcrR family transcriptional regulator [Spirochaetota bacterium]
MNERSKSDIINLRRNQLTRAAYKVVGQKGYYDFTIRDIAREAGLSTGLVHYYFKNKEDLLLNLLKEINKNMLIILNRSISTADDPRDKLNIFMKQAFDLVENEKDYFYIVIDFWTQVNKNDRMKRANIKLFKSYRDEVSKILKEGVDCGVFVKMDVEFTSAVIISIIQGLIIQYVIDNNAFNYDEFSKKVMKHVNDLVYKKK